MSRLLIHSVRVTQDPLPQNPGIPFAHLTVEVSFIDDRALCGYHGTVIVPLGDVDVARRIQAAIMSGELEVQNLIPNAEVAAR